jgi:ATP-dependent DNA helicase RecG
MHIVNLPTDICDALLQQLLPLGETRRLEFKRVSGEMVAKALKTVCAFANTDGGMLVLGVADLKSFQGINRVFGVEENSEAVDELQRKLLTEFLPNVEGLRLQRLVCTLHNGTARGRQGHVLVLQVPRSARVHSVVDGGTYTRLDAGNRIMSASEVTELSYRRGERSATSEALAVPLARLQTHAWQRFASGRGPLTGSFSDQLLRIGLADEVGGIAQPRRAAILLFAEEPGSLLAAFDSRADVRVMVYDGKHVASGATPNLRKPAKSVRGPLIDQIDTAVKIVLDELADGLTLSASGFKTKHAYPERVVKEAIVNAIVHRDYRLNRDIFVRIFDDRVEVESPGLLPGNITPANIAKAGSRARNPLIASNLREFPTPPNIDAGEGVRMMFAEMALAELYPPQYRQGTESEVETVTVTLFNALRPSTWDLVSDWLDRNGAIANADLVRMADVDTLKASKQLTAWRDQGLLVPVPGRAKRNMAYMKPGGVEGESQLLSALRDNNDATEGK